MLNGLIEIIWIFDQKCMTGRSVSEIYVHSIKIIIINSSAAASWIDDV